MTNVAIENDHSYVSLPEGILEIWDYELIVTNPS